MSNSVIDNVVEAVMDMIDSLNLFSLIKRGALGTGNGLSCGIAPSSPEEVYLDKNQTIILDFTINGKHENLDTLSKAMNKIHEVIPMMRNYPSGNGWQIIDIQTITFPQQIGREENNSWLMASSLNVKYATYTRNAPVAVEQTEQE